jgi:hypothetical protein
MDKSFLIKGTNHTPNPKSENDLYKDEILKCLELQGQREVSKHFWDKRTAQKKNQDSEWIRLLSSTQEREDNEVRLSKLCEESAIPRILYPVR